MFESLNDLILKAVQKSESGQQNGVPITARSAAALVGADLIPLAAMLRIPGFVHNIEDAKIYCPSVWSSFGTEGFKGADFCARQTYGSIYG